MAFCLFFHHKSITPNRVVYPLLTLIFAILLSDYMNDFLALGNKVIEDWSKIVTFVVLIFLSVRGEKELKILTTGFVIVFFLYMLHSYYEFRCGRYVSRMGINRMIGIDEAMNDPNSYGGSVVLSLPFIVPLWVLAKNIFLKIMTRVFCACFFILAVICVICTGSRGSMVGLVFFIILTCLMSKYRKQLLLAFIVIVPIVWLTMDASLQNRYLTIIDPSKGPANAQESTEGRIEGVRTGIRLFKKSPVYGFGPGSSVKYSPLKLQAHNLFGQVIGELGAIGLFSYIFLCFMFTINYLAAKYYWKISSSLEIDSSPYYLVVIRAVFVASLLLLLLGLGAHNAFRYNWVWYAAFQAIAVGVLKKKTEELVLQREKLRHKILNGIH
ncbi:MAG: O-antigen ligase family protein [Planctomycetaceae bacterium]|nr:O-antigen ligase family protein [Planctomycetaceae bacterium]